VPLISGSGHAKPTVVYEKSITDGRILCQGFEEAPIA